MKNEELDFSSKDKEELNLMYKEISEMFDLAMNAFDDSDRSPLDDLTKDENIVDEMKDHLSSQHYLRLSLGDCKIELSAYFYSTVSGLERVGDHLVNIGYSILNPTGSQSIAKLEK